MGGGGNVEELTGEVRQESWCSDWTSVHWEGDQALGQAPQSSGHGTKTAGVREVFGQHFQICSLTVKLPYTESEVGVNNLSVLQFDPEGISAPYSPLFYPLAPSFPSQIGRGENQEKKKNLMGGDKDNWIGQKRMGIIIKWRTMELLATRWQMPSQSSSSSVPFGQLR